MIRSIKRALAGLAFAAFAGLFLPASAQAATIYTSCSSVPPGILTGDLIITDSNCVFTHAVIATGFISIVATGSVDAIAVTSTNTSGSDGNIFIQAGTTLKVGTITTKLAIVDLKAQQTSGNALFTIGGTGQTNGVNGRIITTGGSQGGPDNFSTWVYVTNGVAGSTGGIKVTTATDISVAAASGAYRTGTIVLNAQNGSLNVPSLSVAGTASVAAGQIILMADTITLPANATLNASQPATAPVSNHQVALAATTISYTGTLTVNANGNGPGGHDIGGVILESIGSLQAIESNSGDISTEFLTVGPTGIAPSTLNISGGGALSVTATGNNEIVSVSAYPVNFTGGAVTIESEGTTNHGILISNGSSITGQTGLSFAGTGIVTLDADATAATTTAGGYIYINVDQVVLTAPTYIIKANGPTSGPGDGGIVYINSTQFPQNSKKLTISANAASAGMGNAQTGLIVPIISQFQTFPAITIADSSGGSSTIALGNGAADMGLAAAGGHSGGNGGKIFLNFPTSGGTGGAFIKIDAISAASVLAASNVSVLGPTGKGGIISYLAGQLQVFESGGLYTMQVDGGATSGNAGSFDFNFLSAGLVINLSAQAKGMGKGGEISINLTSTTDSSVISGSQFNVSAGKGGNGGDIKVTAAGQLRLFETVSTFTANGATTGNGDGGTVFISAAQISTMGSFGNIAITANAADTAGGNNGGTITITGTDNQPINIGFGGITLSAKGAGTGNGGTINVTNAGTVTADGPSITVNAGSASSSNGAGGNIAITGSQVTLTGSLIADGKGTGQAGTITLSGTTPDQMTLDSATISASGDTAGTGDGNSVSITNGGYISLNGTTINAQGGQSGVGGKGGKISIATVTPIDISEAHINANALSTGSLDGGMVTISNTLTPSGDVALDVLAYVNVKSGSSAGSSVPGGKIMLNGVTCLRQNTGYTTWPIDYWECTNPNTGQDPIPASFGNTYLANLKTQFKSTSVDAFVFTQVADFNAFFGPTPPVSGVLGETFNITTGNTIYVTEIIDGGQINDNVNEVAGHEFGHAAGLSYGPANEYNSSAYTNFVNNDFLYLDYSAVGSSKSTSTPRDPCSNPAAPFYGVVDSSTGRQICGSGTGYTQIPGDAVGIGIESQYIPGGVLMSNSQILFIAQSTVFPFNREIYAQAFTFRAYVQGNVSSTDYQAPTADGVFFNPFFSCTQAWATNILFLVSPHSSGTGACSSPVISWYTPNSPR